MKSIYSVSYTHLDVYKRQLFDTVKTGLSDTFGKLLDVYNTYFVPVPVSYTHLGDLIHNPDYKIYNARAERAADMIIKMLDIAFA